MTNETTASQPMQELVRDLYNFEGGRHFAMRLEKMLASQPKSIRDDAQFNYLLVKLREAWVDRDAISYGATRGLLVKLIDSRAPAAQARAVDLIKAGALRQFKHNDGSPGFVFAYDKAIVDRILAAPMVADPAGVALMAKCEECDGKGGTITAEWVDPVSGPEFEGERCEVCGGAGVTDAVPIAATVKAVPSEALDRAAILEEAARCVEDFQAGNGTVSFNDIALSIRSLAAPLADKTGRGE